MFRFLLICGQIWAEPWSGKNTGLMEGLSTGLRDVELTGRHLLSVPGPVAAQEYRWVAIYVHNKPERACGCQHQTQRVRPQDALPFATLLSA
jgi:hypothetical protein